MNILDSKQPGNKALRETIISWLTKGKSLRQTLRDTNIKKDLAKVTSTNLQLQTLGMAFDCNDKLDYSTYIDESIRKNEWADALLMG